ncbi:hypothetical protein [Mesorhizobium sp. dw_380]|uniref:hypothetical protein n=1 Tax=Mesorhizobium sp. dw_380 TaxID=2812001 RepID=UPI001BDE41E3|nr:hypothetical protein [Mesorhizobium sp. dw_380]
MTSGKALFDMMLPPGAIFIAFLGNDLLLKGPGIGQFEIPAASCARRRGRRDCSWGHGLLSCAAGRCTLLSCAAGRRTIDIWQQIGSFSPVFNEEGMYIEEI